MDVNMNILRPVIDAPLIHLQRTEELIKRKMITMLHYDSLQNSVQQNRKGVSTSMVQAQAHLVHHPHIRFEDLAAAAKKLLSGKMQVVKDDVTHIRRSEFRFLYNRMSGMFITDFVFGNAEAIHTNDVCIKER